MNKIKRTEIFTRWQNQNPKPKTELNYSSSWTHQVKILCKNYWSLQFQSKKRNRHLQNTNG